MKAKSDYYGMGKHLHPRGAMNILAAFVAFDIDDEAAATNRPEFSRIV
jgi:hypothetical protein